ncbi:MAG TPA: DMT family transporter [Pyrinomonadaceae bacterium]
MTKAIFYTAFALVAFAFNSILCRMALRSGEADAAGFTLVRLVSGAVALVVISFLVGSPRLSKTSVLKGHGNWLSAFLLFAYAICFSFAYLGLTAGTGALILFGSVQLTMIVCAIIHGERPHALEWIGLNAAVAGLVYLVLPGLSAPPIRSSALMAAAGAAWGFYTLRGRGSTAPLTDTAGNFLRSVPMVVIAAIPFLSKIDLSTHGIALAIASGAVTSGIGYSIWYAALRHLTATRAAVVQLAVPLLTAGFGILLLSELATERLAIAAALILGGIALMIFNKKGHR